VAHRVKPHEIDGRPWLVDGRSRLDDGRPWMAMGASGQRGTERKRPRTTTRELLFSMAVSHTGNHCRVSLGSLGFLWGVQSWTTRPNKLCISFVYFSWDILSVGSCSGMLKECKKRGPNFFHRKFCDGQKFGRFFRLVREEWDPRDVVLFLLRRRVRAFCLCYTPVSLTHHIKPIFLPCEIDF
jgi:hypothetical protein